jgi:pyruvate dehydrogenase E2 component (dihydrolipoamide acetyltransferase)
MTETALVDITLVDVGEGISEAQILEWLVAVGQNVSADQSVVLISTDKAAVELPAPVSGILREQLVQVGATVPVGSTLARIEATQPADGMLTSHVTEPWASPTIDAATSVPTVRPLARELNTELATPSPSGPNGQILDEDVSRPTDGTPSIEEASRRSQRDRVDDLRTPLRGMRLTIARSTTASWRDVPHIVEFRQIDATRLQQTREAYRSQIESDNIHLTFLPFFVKATAIALSRHPSFNAQLDMESEEIIQHQYCNIGIATAIDSGLTVPVLRNVEHQSVSDIAHALSTLIERARRQTLLISEMTGGTFTITNFGSYGTWLGTPIIRTPEVAIAGFGRIQPAVVAVDGMPVVRPVLPLSVATDHRLNDGLHLAAFVETIAELLANPSTLLTEKEGVQR